MRHARADEQWPGCVRSVRVHVVTSSRLGLVFDRMGGRIWLLQTKVCNNEGDDGNWQTHCQQHQHRHQA